MKKLLSILSILTVSSSISTTVVSCNKNTPAKVKKVDLSETEFKQFIYADQNLVNETSDAKRQSDIISDILNNLGLTGKVDAAKGIDVKDTINKDNGEISLQASIKGNEYINDTVVSAKIAKDKPFSPSIHIKKVDLTETEFKQFIAKDKNLINETSDVKIQQDVTNDIVNGLKLSGKSDVTNGINVQDTIDKDKSISLDAIIDNNPYINDSRVKATVIKKVDLSETEFKQFISSDQDLVNKTSDAKIQQDVTNDIVNGLKLNGKSDVTNGINVQDTINKDKSISLDVAIKNNKYINDTKTDLTIKVAKEKPFTPSIPIKKVDLSETEFKQFISADKNLVHETSDAKIQKDVINDIVNGLKLSSKSDVTNGIIVKDNIKDGVISLDVAIKNNKYINDTKTDLTATVIKYTKPSSLIPAKYNIDTSTINLSEKDQNDWIEDWNVNYYEHKDMYDLVAEQIAQNAKIKCSSADGYYKTVTNDGVQIQILQNGKLINYNSDNLQFGDDFAVKYLVNSNSKHFQATNGWRKTYTFTDVLFIAKDSSIINRIKELIKFGVPESCYRGAVVDALTDYFNDCGAAATYEDVDNGLFRFRDYIEGSTTQVGSIITLYFRLPRSNTYEEIDKEYGSVTFSLTT